MKKLLKKLSNFLYKKKIQTLRAKISSKKNIEGAQFVDLNSSKEPSHAIKVEKIIEKYIKTPNKLFDYIEHAGVKIYKIKKPDKILGIIQEEQGFIYPKKGFEALYLNLILNKKISFKTAEMFVIDERIDIYTFLYQFYHWYSYRMGVKGFESAYSDKMKYVFKFSNPKKIDNLSYDEIMELKLAIKRDIEAIDFVKKIAIKNDAAKKCHNKILKGTGANI